MKIRTRFAPSPTGKMHVGNLRTGLYAYLIAKHAGGDFMLRIEDTDQERFVEGATDIIYRTLEKAGLTHDEGPDKDGGYGPYVQSERMKTGIYMQYAKELVDKGEAYYCFCDKERLASLKSEVVEGKEISVYDKHCLRLSREEVEANLAAGKPFVIRQNNPTEGTTTFHDELYGDITVENAQLDDMILMKSDGFPTYNFANVVDDHTMNITHVVRGNEYISSSPKYQRLYDAFGWQSPVYVHLPLVTDENHKKLAKRSENGSYIFEEMVEQGFVAEAVVNYIALLGWSPEEAAEEPSTEEAPSTEGKSSADEKNVIKEKHSTEIFSLEELVREFDYHRISKSPAVFDNVKLRWMNGEYIKAMDFDRFYERAELYLKEVLTKDLDLKKIANMVKTRIEVFTDIAGHVDFFERLPEYDVAMYTHKKMKTDSASSLEVLRDVLPLLEAQEDYSNDGLYQMLLKYAEEKGARTGKAIKTGFVMWPIRTALSGKQMTPAGATEIMEVLGREESLARIRKGIELLEQSEASRG